MNMTKKLIVAALALPLILGAAGGYAFDRGHGQGGSEGRPHEGPGGPGGCGGFESGLMYRLDLTDEQKDQLKELRAATRADRRGVEQRKTHHDKMQQLMLAEEFDADAAQALVKEMESQRDGAMVRKMQHEHDMLSILTPEQKEQFVKLQQERQQSCQDRAPRHPK